MRNRDDKQTEDFLRTFSLKSSPPGLKEKILLVTQKGQKSYAMMNSFLRRGLMGCLPLLIFIIAIDAVITHAQNKRLSSFVHKKKESTVLREEERSLIKDIIGEFSDPTKAEAGMNLYHYLEKKKSHQTEWRESFKKEMEQNESTKDLR